MKLSLLDLALVRTGQRPRDAFAASVAMAQRAEAAGYERVWYAEHHNMAAIASSAPAVLIAHVAAHTATIRLGSGGVMLPNHSPLIVAEQFGTLAELHPGRIDLGLGRAPGTDQVTVQAMRRDPAAAERFPQDLRELQGYLGDASIIDGVTANPGAGTHVPIYLLGSSMFGAQAAAHFGLPYAFASHFAPRFLQDAVAEYRNRFQPSDQLAEPYVIAAANAVAAETAEAAQAQFDAALRARVQRFLAPGRTLSDEQMERLLLAPQGRQVADMMRHTVVGTVHDVGDQLREFATFADADEVMVACAARDLDDRLQAIDLLAESIAKPAR